MDEQSINRRDMMLACMAGLAVAGLGRLALGQPASTAAGNAATYRLRVGDIQATVVSDGVLSGPPSVYAGDAPEAELREVLTRAFFPTAPWRWTSTPS